MDILSKIILVFITLLITTTQNSLSAASTSNIKFDHNATDVVNSYMMKAQNSMEIGDYQTAMEVFEEAIFSTNVTHIKLYNQFGVLLMNIMYNYAYSESIFKTALSLGIESNATDDMDQLAHVYHNMGMCQMFLGNFNQSKWMFEQSIKMNRSVTVKISYHKLGELLFNHLNDYANAIAMFEKVLELDSTHVQACVDISTILLSLNHQFTLKRSQELFDKITKVLTNDFVLYNNFGAMMVEKYHAWTYARAIFTESLSFNVTDSVRSVAVGNLAMVDQQNRNYTSAATLLKKAIQLNPLHIDWYLRLTYLLIEAFGNYHEAAQFYVDAFKIQPDNTLLVEKLSEMLNQHKVLFDEIYTLIDNTNNFELMFRFGVVLVEQKQARYANARSLFLKCVTIDSSSWNAWYYLGFAQSSIGEYDAAITSLNNSIQLYPCWNTYYILGSVYSQISGKLSEVQKMFETAIQLAPDTLSLTENSDLALCHLKLGLTLEILYNKNETQQLKSMYHFEQSISIDPKSYPLARVKYAVGLLIRGFDADAAIETIKQGLKINPNDDLLLDLLASMQTVMHKTDHNTIEMFQTGIYKLNTTIPGIHLEYAKYLFHNQLQTKHDDRKTVQEIETMLYKAIHLFSINPDPIATDSKDESYHQLALLKMKTLHNNNESFKYQQVLQIYQQGLNNIPDSCLLHVGKAYLLQNEHFKQYDESIALYQHAIQLCGDIGQRSVCKVNAMLNLANLLIDHDQYKYANSHNYNHSELQYLIESGCTSLIKALNGAFFFMLQRDWVGNFETTMKNFENTTLNHVDKSLIYQTLGLYYESLNQFRQALVHFIMSIHYNDKNNNTNDLITVSYWKVGKINSRYLKKSNTTTVLQYFSIAVDQSSRTPNTWKHFQLSELYYDFGYFLKTKMNDNLNATKYFSKSVELNAFNIKSKKQLNEIIDKHEDMLSQADKCSLCLGIMIDSFQSIHTNNCTHRFHTNCIDKWYQNKKEKVCPLCREPQP